MFTFLLSLVFMVAMLMIVAKKVAGGGNIVFGSNRNSTTISYGYFWPIMTVCGYLLLMIMMSLNPFITVKGGHRGIVSTWGAIQHTELGEGIHWVFPIAQQVEQWDVRTFKAQVVSNTVSNDLQKVVATTALNYHVQPDRVSELKQSTGNSFPSVIIEPAMQEAIKLATAQYSIQDLMAKRNEVRDTAKEILRKKLVHYFIIVDEFTIVNFDFSDKYEAAIEAKQISEQTAEKAKFDLEKVKTDSEQKVAQARAEAEALRMQKEQITPELLELRRIEMQKAAIEKWKGDVPQYMMGTATPFINLTPGR